MNTSTRALLFTALLSFVSACSIKQGAPSGRSLTPGSSATALSTADCGDSSTACGAWCFQVCGDACHGAGTVAECAQAKALVSEEQTAPGACGRCQQGIQRWQPVCTGPSVLPSCPEPDAGLFSFDSVYHLDDGQDAGLGDPTRPTFPDGGDVFSTLSAPFLVADVSNGSQLIWTAESDGVATTEYSGFNFLADPSGVDRSALSFLLSRFVSENQFDCTQAYTSVTYIDTDDNVYYAAASQTGTSCSVTLIHRSTGAGDADEITFSAHLSSFSDGSTLDLTNGLMTLSH